MTNLRDSITDHRDDGGTVSPLEFAAVQAVQLELDERIRRLEARLLGSKPPMTGDSIDLSVSRESGLRVHGASGTVAVILVTLGVLLALASAAKYWGPPARWSGPVPMMGTGGK